MTEPSSESIPPSPPDDSILLRQSEPPAQDATLKAPWEHGEVTTAPETWIQSTRLRWTIGLDDDGEPKGWMLQELWKSTNGNFKWLNVPEVGTPEYTASGLPE